MRQEQIQAALDSAAEGISPFFHITAEELEKLLAVMVTLDMLGQGFTDLMTALCTVEGGSEIRLCHQFGYASSTTLSESDPPASTPA